MVKLVKSSRPISRSSWPISSNQHNIVQYIALDWCCPIHIGQCIALDWLWPIHIVQVKRNRIRNGSGSGSLLLLVPPTFPISWVERSTMKDLERADEELQQAQKMSADGILKSICHIVQDDTGQSGHRLGRLVQISEDRPAYRSEFNQDDGKIGLIVQADLTIVLADQFKSAQYRPVHHPGLDLSDPYRPVHRPGLALADPYRLGIGGSGIIIDSDGTVLTHACSNFSLDSRSKSNEDHDLTLLKIQSEIPLPTTTFDYLEDYKGRELISFEHLLSRRAYPSQNEVNKDGNLMLSDEEFISKIDYKNFHLRGPMAWGKGIWLGWRGTSFGSAVVMRLGGGVDTRRGGDGVRRVGRKKKEARVEENGREAEKIWKTKSSPAGAVGFHLNVRVICVVRWIVREDVGDIKSVVGLQMSRNRSELPRAEFRIGAGGELFFAKTNKDKIARIENDSPAVLAIGLRMVCRTEIKRGVKALPKFSPEMADELDISIRGNTPRESMQADDFVEK
ncbi:hypothetical protein KFK09_006831 [Dendrobium nobile]|uniref:Uncharacterized protein n=1 Tax=Dendrobium nobile TaxID=94219 RepID=A0A8T3BQ77_DENNO|nr:hypothetical protein KFK09_006831 [Dendrobium nobile]